MPEEIPSLPARIGHRRWPFSPPLLRKLLLVALLSPLSPLLTPIAMAQMAGEAPQLDDWRAANDAVAQFKRGHIDLLKWERRNVPDEVLATEVTPDLVLTSAADAVRQAWRVHSDLARVQSRLGDEATLALAEGRLDAIDPVHQRRVQDMDELLAVATETRKLWIEAVAARQALRFREAALTSAEAGHELGRRMVRVGNWSPLQAAPMQLAAASVRLDLHRARLAAAQAELALVNGLRLAGTASSLGLPSELPELPAEIMAREAWAQRLAQVQGHLPGASAVQNRVAAEMADRVVRASHALALTQRDEVLKVRRFITEETVLHYNGMLKSVWDLLAEVRNQAVAEIDTINTLRDFWLAQADWQWTLQGGAPMRFVAPGSANGGDAGGAAAH